MIKVGVKLGPRMAKDYFSKINQFADFFEIYGREDFDYSNFYGIDKPVVVHAPHFMEAGVNLANPCKEAKNLRAIYWAKEMADKFKSDKIVIHPELIEDDNNSIDVTVKFIKKHFDSRFHIENMPFASVGNKHFGGTPEEVEYIVKNTNVKFCFDFMHAAEYAAYESIGFKEVFKSFMELKPGYFHLSDANLDLVSDSDYVAYHLNLFEGTLDLNLVREVLPDKSWILLETPQIADKQKKEIEFLKEKFC